MRVHTDLLSSGLSTTFQSVEFRKFGLVCIVELEARSSAGLCRKEAQSKTCTACIEHSVARCNSCTSSALPCSFRWATLNASMETQYMGSTLEQGNWSKMVSGSSKCSEEIAPFQHQLPKLSKPNLHRHGSTTAYGYLQEHRTFNHLRANFTFQYNTLNQ